MHMVSGAWTLDIECLTDESYHLLYRGFQLLLEKTNHTRQTLLQQKNNNSSGTGTIDHRSPEEETEQGKINPVTALFAAPVHGLGGSILRTLRHRSARGFGLAHGLTPLALTPPPAQFVGWTSAGTQVGDLPDPLVTLW